MESKLWTFDIRYVRGNETKAETGLIPSLVVLRENKFETL